MIIQNKKYIVKIPTDTSVLYCEKKKVLTILGPLKKKSLKLKLKLCINNKKKMLSVSSDFFSSVSNYEKKNIKAVRGSTVALIKQILVETSTLISQKLKLHGMGYRVSLHETNDSVLIFKLGYSHLIFIRFKTQVSVSCLSKTKFCLFGHSYTDINQMSAFIRSCRTPEPYKGKGVLFNDEIVVLKEGKKV